MKHKISITLATLAACAFTLPAFASYTDLMDKTTLTVGLNFTQADGNGTDYLYSPVECLCNGQKDHYQIKSLHPKSHFDWSVGLAYRLNCSKNSFVVEYNQFRDTTSIDTHAESPNTTNSYAHAYGTVADGASVKASVRYDEKDVKFGFRRTANYCGAEVVLGALFEYAEVTRDFNRKLPAGAYDQLDARESVKGWGPAFDMTTTVKLCGTKDHTFNAFANLGVALLKTNNDYRQTVRNNGAVALDSNHNFCGERTHSIVSKLDMALGLGWKGSMACCPDISLKAGVKYLNYSNLFKSGSVHLGTDGTPALPERAVGDYGRFGPFIEFSIGGSKA